MKVLIVEDETIAYEYLTELIGRVDPDIEIVAVTESISQTTKWLNTHPSPDLIFMDIHLSDGSAFSIFDLITVETPIIFTTAYDEYAINAFKVNSIDYLLKPVEEEDLRKAIGKFRKLTSPERVRYLEQQAQTNYSGNYFRKLLVAHRDNLVPVDVEQIVYFYTSDHQTSICLTDGRQFTYNKTLDSIIQNLDPVMFFRANKQFIVSKEHVTNITIWFDRRLLITLRTDTPERIYVSKNRSTEFKEWMMGGSTIKI
ncbi:MAG: LytTR family DNA-binding domain-containing protein [Bacteroides sp.]|nr:LytTR family DNA-binding domain-containing protein [Bacteroides sp.]